MLWYNNYESVEAIRQGRLEDASEQNVRLMRLVRSHDDHALAS